MPLTNETEVTGFGEWDYVYCDVIDGKRRQFGWSNQSWTTNLVSEFHLIQNPKSKSDSDSRTVSKSDKIHKFLIFLDHFQSILINFDNF